LFAAETVMSGAQPIQRFDPVADVRSEIERLSMLALCRQGLPAYYAALLSSHDERLRVAAMAALLELSSLKPDQWELAVRMSCHDAVRQRAFKFFSAKYEYDFAARAMEIRSSIVDELRSRSMSAELRREFDASIRLSNDLFLATGNIEHLHEAQRLAEMTRGWRAAVPMAVTSILAQPADPRGPYFLFGYLYDASQIDLIDLLCDVFQSAGLHPRETMIFRAFTLVSKGRPKDAIRTLDTLQVQSLSNTLKTLWYRARALALEALEQFRPAYQAFVQMNEVGVPPQAADLGIGKAAFDKLEYDMPLLPPDGRSKSDVMLVGFPRSGTTLLENVLAAHPRIETFEEIPALSRAVSFIDRSARPGSPVSTEAALTARGRYYEEVDRRKTKAGAAIFVDKLPLNASAIKLLEKLLPGKRYIFAIRHPHDVVLSCFRQHFARNRAMDNFRRFEDACRLYDFVMSQWFDVFSLTETERVAYVRYEELVGDFKATADRVLNFLGTDWDDKVLDFAALAQRRSANTPSYQKVRGGLQLGVQSAWRNYEFLFKTASAEPLKRWVGHFGYAN
jgi:hypothetical protein